MNSGREGSLQLGKGWGGWYEWNVAFFFLKKAREARCDMHFLLLYILVTVVTVLGRKQAFHTTTVVPKHNAEGPQQKKRT